MASILYINNPFEPFKIDELDKFVDVPEMSVLDWLNRKGTWEGFDRPTIVIVNGEAIMQADYASTIMRKDDIVNFVTLVGDPVSIIIAIVVAVVAVIATLAFAPQPPAVGDTPEPDSVFSLRGQRNQNKLGQAIPAHYGRKKNWPDIAATPYAQYIGNQQYLYSLFCAGQGEYDFTDFQIEETPVANFQDVIIEVYGPGEEVTLFPEAVVTPVSPQSVELYGPNEPNFPPSGFSGPFVIQDPQTTAYRIEFDVVLSNGLYFSNDDGGLSPRTVDATFEYQEIDNSGTPIGSWLVADNFTQTLATNTPQRFTIGLDVPAGRYQVRGTRTNNASTSHRVGDTLVWESVRAFLQQPQNYGNVTMIAMRALADDNLNNSARTRLNCIQTRKLPGYDPNTGQWSQPNPTRNPIWAVFDVFKAEYGGRLTDQFMDIETMAPLATQFAQLGLNFDWTFDLKTNVLAAAKMVLSVARTIPVLNGSQISAIRDEISSIPLQVFSPQNMLAGSFSWDIKMFKLNDHNGLKLEYLDEDTWKPETMLVTIGTESGDNAKNFKVNGIINRDKAWQYGLYVRAKEVLQREVIKFKTGLEGNLPAINSLISVSHDVPKWGASGYVTNYGPGSSSLYQEVYLSEEYTFLPNLDYQILYRDKMGNAHIEHVANQADVFQQPLTIDRIFSSGIIAGTTNIDLDRDYNEEPVFYQLGEENMESKLCRVRSIKPSGDNTVAIEAVNNDDQVYSYDTATAPPKTDVLTPPEIPDVPVVGGLVVIPVPNEINKVQATWQAAVGARNYIVELSYDGLAYTQLGTTTGLSFIIDVVVGTAYIRVAGVNISIGPYDEWVGQVGVATDLPNNITDLALQSPFVGTTARLQWTAVNTASSYVITTESSGVTISTDEVFTPGFDYDIGEAQIDFSPNPVERTLTFTVASKNTVGLSDNPPALTTTNPVPTPPSTVTVVNENAGTNPTAWSVKITWSQVFESDIEDYIVYASDTSGFTPGPTNEIGRGQFLQLTAQVLNNNQATQNYYIRVGIKDVWGPEIELTSEQSIDLQS